MTPARTRVLFLLPSLIAGGAQRVFGTLLRHLDRNRFEIHLGLLEAKGAYLAEVPADVVVHDLHVTRVRYSLPGIIRVVRKVRPQVVLSTLVYLNLSLLMVRPFLPRGTRLLIRESTIPSAFFREETRWPRFWRWLMQRLYGKAEKVICLSDSMAQEMVDRFRVPREKAVRIYNPVDAEMIHRLAESGGNPFQGPGPFLVTAGRLSPEKGVDVLLDAMPAVLDRLPGARLFVLGDGPLAARLQHQAERLGLAAAVHFAGFQRNPWPYLKHAHLFVLPSRYEGLPNAVLESLALGTPVVATDCPGGIREIRERDDRVTLAPPEDSPALANAIVSACARSASGTDAAGSGEGRLDEFSVQRVVSRYSDLF